MRVPEREGEREAESSVRGDEREDRSRSRIIPPPTPTPALTGRCRQSPRTFASQFAHKHARAHMVGGGDQRGEGSCSGQRQVKDRRRRTATLKVLKLNLLTIYSFEKKLLNLF